MKRSAYHLMLAVPTRGTVSWQTITRLNEVRDATPGLRPIVFQPGNLSVALTRNRIVETFLASDCETLVMIDDDCVPSPHFLEALDRLVPEYALAAVPHVMPNPADSSRLILTAFDVVAGGLTPAALDDGVNDVDAVATGCVAVSRQALVALGPNPFRISNDPAEPVSDDFLFCADLKAAGFRIAAWWDGWPCDHISTVSLGPLFESQQLALAAGRSVT
jgi:hypothetical protein